MLRVPFEAEDLTQGIIEYVYWIQTIRMIRVE